jgi:hypothetical protein
VYTLSREYEEGQLTFVTPQAFQWFVHLEKLFIAAAPYLSKVKDSRRLTDIFKSTGAAFKFQNCHDIELKILKRFTVFRLKIHCDFVSRLSKQKATVPAATGSSTAGGKAYIDNPKSGKRKSATATSKEPPKKRVKRK